METILEYIAALAVMYIAFLIQEWLAERNEWPHEKAERKRKWQGKD